MKNICGKKFALSIEPITIDFQKGFNEAWIDRYRNDKEFAYMIMPKYGHGLISKN